jgi:hypothetical protein
MRVSRGGWIAIAVLSVAALAAGVFAQRRLASKPRARTAVLTHSQQGRQILFQEIQPVALANCELQRFGEPNDGGYMLCGNLLREVQSSYSYGISGYDQWGCDVSATLGVPVHEYDCFNLTQPVCATGRAMFHGECIGDSQRVEEGRPFDTLENQIRKNGDAGKHLVVKMDVEGAEWESFLGVSDAVLQRIDQMTVEFHGFDEDRHLLAMWKLKKFFHIAHLHWNNFACEFGVAPFPSNAYEVLFVNKRIGMPAPGAPVIPSPLDQPNNPKWRDCQSLTTAP